MSDNLNRDFDRPSSLAHPFHSLVEDLLKNAGWHVEVEPRLGQARPDFLINQGPHSYVVEVKSAHEGRKNRLIPLLSMAILQAQNAAHQSPRPTVPLAIVVAPRIPDSTADEMRQFASRYAPNVAIGLIDLEGFRAFEDPALQALSAERSPSAYDRLPINNAGPSGHLFSDASQWLLKILLAKQIPENLLQAPRAEYRNASQLAEAARVSVMSAFRFIRLLEAEGFLEHSGRVLKLVRIEHLLYRWQAASLKPQRDFPFRWVLKGKSSEKLLSMLRLYQADLPIDGSFISQGNDWKIRYKPRMCLGLFSAAAALGFAMVRGVPDYIYVDRMDHDLMDHLGLSQSDEGKPVDVYVRVAAARRSVFRGAVVRDGIPVSDILQVWLDVSAHPARGSEQADEIKRRVLDPLLMEAHV